MRTDPTRRRLRSCRPRPEPLESRLALSDLDGPTGLLVVPVAALAEPVPGSVLTTSPGALVVSFDRPINPDLLGADLVLTALDADGAIAWFEPLEPGSLDPGGTTLAVPLGLVLSPGLYQVLVAPDSDLADLDGNPLVVDNQPQLVGEFGIVAPAGVTLDAAADLGTLVGGSAITVPGDLDFLADPHAVAIYKITLPEGASWQLGLEVASEREGGALDSALALFDGLGRPIATAEIGRSDAPYDPFLFAGIDPGVYYIGVSGTEDLPGRPDGYDLDAGTAGTILQTQPGGAFTLHIVADPVVEPVRLLEFAVDRAVPGDPDPAGFTLGFSGAIRIDDPDDDNEGLAGAVEVVDQDGRTWPVMARQSDGLTGRISYLFGRRLPAGLYTVRLAPGGGLVDLGGMAPVAPDLPPSVLGTFSVAARAPLEGPKDLDALLPDDALEGVSLAGELSPGQTIDYRVVLTLQAFYTLQGRYTGAGLNITQIGPDGTTAIDAGEPGSFSGTNLAFLRPAGYVIRFRATGPGPVAYHFTFRASQGPPAIFPANGLGQGPALSMRLVDPSDPGAPPGVVRTPTAPRSRSSATTSLGAGDFAAPPTSARLRKEVYPGPILSLRRSDFVGRPAPDGRFVTMATAVAVRSAPSDAPSPSRGARAVPSSERRPSSPARPGGAWDQAAAPAAGKPPVAAELLEASTAAINLGPWHAPREIPTVTEGPRPAPMDPAPDSLAAGEGEDVDIGIDRIVLVCVGLVTGLAARARQRIDRALRPFLVRHIPRRRGRPPARRRLPA